ncbi:MAG: hypothetical protein AAGA60_09410 [Cyanobacteria bacterium P01_E01_bin.42]
MLAAKIWAYYVSVPPNAFERASRALERLPERSPQAEEMQRIIQWTEEVLPRTAN